MARPSDKSDNKKKMLEALGESKGIVTTACKNIPMSPDTHYRWLKEDEVYAEAVKMVQESCIDFVESKLLEKINGVQGINYDKDGNPVPYDVVPSDTAIIFYLKTKAKHRGYIERQEITGKDGEPINKVEIGFADGEDASPQAE